MKKQVLSEIMRYTSSWFSDKQPQNRSRQRVPIDPRRLRQRMVKELESRGITARAVLEAMGSVPRHLFVPEALQVHAYEDSPLPIGFGQTISQPYSVALMTQLLNAKAGMRVLEIGTGSGYQSAILAKMDCVVYGVERLRPLFTQSLALLRRLGFRNVHLFLGDGTLGLAHIGPFNRILVAAGGPEVPAPLVGQLADNGVMMIPVGPRQRAQRLLRITRVGSIIRTEDMGPAGFVNLVGSYGWQE